MSTMHSRTILRSTAVFSTTGRILNLVYLGMYMYMYLESAFFVRSFDQLLPETAWP
eukprot:SAG11_NODE_52_length_19809_cov_14.064231_13_plen_56_part_00